MRGEHSIGAGRRNDTLGSSPHARGALSRPCAHHVRPGIIPACAGSTLSRAKRTETLEDHPRMRGEHQIMGYHSAKPRGSSPHARGAREGWAYHSCGARIIPACAGSTYRQKQTARHGRDHPRMRGEHFLRHRAPVKIRGSSPHARGAPPLDRAPGDGHGIIPACAGSTLPVRVRAARREDHPRMRGEHIVLQTWCEIPTGSSPHARGAQSGLCARGCISGIIPACAGSTRFQANHIAQL